MPVLLSCVTSKEYLQSIAPVQTRHPIKYRQRFSVIFDLDTGLDVLYERNKMQSVFVVAIIYC